MYERPDKGIKIKAAKLPNGNIEIIAEGPLQRKFEFTYAIPPCDTRGVHIVITWQSNEVTFYVNATLIHTFIVN